MAGSACVQWTCEPSGKGHAAPLPRPVRRGRANGTRFSSRSPRNLATLTPGYSSAKVAPDARVLQTRYRRGNVSGAEEAGRASERREDHLTRDVFMNPPGPVSSQHTLPAPLSSYLCLCTYSRGWHAPPALTSALNHLIIPIHLKHCYNGRHHR